MANPPIPAPPLADAAPSTPSLRTLGTGSQQAAAGNDSRLSTPADAQTTPAANKIPLADGTGVIAPGWLADASASTAGKVSVSAQTFAGLKTFQNGIEASSINSTAASNANAITFSNIGARLTLGNTSRYLYDTTDAIGVNGMLRVSDMIVGTSLSVTATSGNYAMSANNAGARFSFGNTNRYLYDTGSAIEFISPVSATSLTSTATSGQNALTIISGSRILLDSSQPTRYLAGSGGNQADFVNLLVTSGLGFSSGNGVYQTSGNSSASINGVVSDSSTAVATILRSNGTYSTAGAKITSFRNGTSEIAAVDYLGNISGNSLVTNAASGANAITMLSGSRIILNSTQPTRYLAFGGSNQADFVNLFVTAGLGFSSGNGVYQTSGQSTATLNGVVNDGATAVATALRSNGTYSTAGAKITSFRNGTSEIAFVDKDGLVSADSFVATTATGNTLTGGGASGPLTIASNTPDSQTSSTVPAIKLKANQAITTGDLLLSVENSTGTSRFSVMENGGINTDIRITTPEVNSGGGLLLRASAGAGNAHTIRADASPTNIAVFSTLSGGTQASVSLTGDITGKSFASTAASGANAFTASTVGSRLSLGNTARYIYDDGVTLRAIQYFQADSGFLGPGIISGGALNVQGNSSTIGVTIKAGNASAGTIAQFVDSTNTSKVAVNSNGDLVPGTTNISILGSSSRRWNNLHTHQITFADGTTQTTSTVVNVKDFGAKGDGVTDDTAAIQAAINSLTQGGGGTLLIAKGYYKISDTLNVGLPTFSTYSVFTGRTGNLNSATVDSYKISANITSNAQLSAIDIMFDGGAVLFTSASWTPSARSPVLAYNLRTSTKDTGRGGIYNACIVSAVKLSGGVYNQSAGGTDPISNNFIGIFANSGCKRIEKTFISGINDGLISSEAYWTTVSDYTFHYGDGWGLNVYDGNALFMNNLLFYVARGGFIFQGGASTIQGIHTQTVKNDIWITSSENCIFGPGYIEDVSLTDGTNDVAIKTGVTENANEVISSRFVGLRVGTLRPNKTAFRFWAIRNSIAEGNRAYSSPVIFDSSSYVDDVNNDWAQTAPAGNRTKRSSARTIWANFEPTGSQNTVNGPWMFNITNLDLGTINAGATYTHLLQMPTSTNNVNYLAAYVTNNSSTSISPLVINTRQINSLPKNIEITFSNTTASPIVVGVKSFVVVVFSGGA